MAIRAIASIIEDIKAVGVVVLDPKEDSDLRHFGLLTCRQYIGLFNKAVKQYHDKYLVPRTA